MSLFEFLIKKENIIRELEKEEKILRRKHLKIKVIECISVVEDLQHKKTTDIVNLVITNIENGFDDRFFMLIVDLFPKIKTLSLINFPENIKLENLFHCHSLTEIYLNTNYCNNKIKSIYYNMRTYGKLKIYCRCNKKSHIYECSPLLINSNDDQVKYYKLILFKATLNNEERNSFMKWLHGMCVDNKGYELIQRFKNESYNYEFIKNKNLAINNEILNRNQKI